MTNMPKKNIIHIQYCINCQSHNWNTHHNQAKYHQTYIKLKNLIEEFFKQNAPIVTRNKVPAYLLPIKQHENKFYNSLTKKYIFFPNIGSFQVTFNDQLIFSKKKTNSWPCFQTVLNEISIKLLQKPLLLKQKEQKKLETNQTQQQIEFPQYSSKLPQQQETLHRQQGKSSSKNYSNFTLTDHFKTYHSYNKKASQPSNYFDSSSTIKQTQQVQLNMNKMNVQDIDRLRKVLKNSSKNDLDGIKNQLTNSRGESQKLILINLCSIEGEQSHDTDIKQMGEYRIAPTYKKPSPSLFMNVHLQPINNLSANKNNSQKSLSLKRFQEFNCDLKKIQKQFKHIEKKINKRDDEDQINSSRLNEEKESNYDQITGKLTNDNVFNLRVKANSKQESNYLSNHIERSLSRQNQLSLLGCDLQNSQVKPTNRYDQRYISPTYHEQTQLNANKKCKKFSQIQKYLKANNQQKNKKLKRIYGDWKVSINSSHQKHHLSGGKNVPFRDTTNKHLRNGDGLNSPSQSSYSSSQQRDQYVGINSKKSNRKSRHQSSNKLSDQTVKHPSFVIKHQSSYNPSGNVEKSFYWKKDSNNSQKAKNQRNVSQKHYKVSDKQIVKVTIKQEQIEDIRNSKSLYSKNNKNKSILELNSNKNGKNIENKSIGHNQGKIPIQQSKVKLKQIKALQNKKKTQNLSATQLVKNLFKSAYSNSKQNSWSQKLNNGKKIEPNSIKFYNSSLEEGKDKVIRPQNQHKSGKNYFTDPNKSSSKKLKSIDKKESQLYRQMLEQDNQKYINQDQNNSHSIKNTTDDNSAQKGQNVSIQFNDFYLSIKSKRPQQQIKTKNIEEKQPIQNNQNEEQINEGNKGQNKQKIKQFSISQQLMIKINMCNQNYRQILKTKRIQQAEEQGKQIDQNDLVEQNQSKSQNRNQIKQQDQLVPCRLQLNKNHNSNQQNTFEPQKTQGNSQQLQNNLTCKHHQQSRLSSLCGPATYSNSFNVRNNELQSCKCTHREELVQTNRDKIQSQRKLKKLLKQKRFEENKKRREMLESQKQKFLNKLQEQMNNRELQSQKSVMKKIQKSRSLLIRYQKQQKHSLSNSISKSYYQNSKIKAKKQSNNIKQTSKKNQPAFNNTFPNKLNQSTSEYINEQSVSTNAKKRHSLNQAEKQNIKDKITSKNTSAQKKLNKKQQTPVNKKKNQMSVNKQSKSVSLRSSRKQQIPVNREQNQRSENKQSKSVSLSSSKKGSNAPLNKHHTNNSYFKVQKLSKEKSQVKSNHVETQWNHFETQSNHVETQSNHVETQSIHIETQQYKDATDAIYEVNKQNSIAIQTMNFDELSLKKQQRTDSQQQVISRRSQPNLNVQSRVSSVKQTKNSQIIKQADEGEATKSVKNINQQELKTSFKNANKKITKAKTLASNNQQNDEKLTEKSIVNFFQSQDLIDNKSLKSIDFQKQRDRVQQNRNLLSSFKFQRQDALILNQLYRMEQNLAKQKESYERMYENNQVYIRRKEQQQKILQNQKLIFQELQNKERTTQEKRQRTQKLAFITLQQLIQPATANQNLKLFGTQSIQITKLKSHKNYLTRNLHKVLHILADKNDLLIVRLFEDHKSGTKLLVKQQQYDEKQVFVQKSKYAVWLCVNQTWRLITVSNVLPALELAGKHRENQRYQPVYSYHEGNQLWPYILQKCLAVAIGGYSKLFSLSVGQIFTILTGSNHLCYLINENLSKNKSLLKQIDENQKKNFFMICQRYPMSLKQQNEKMIQQTKIYHLLSKKTVNNGQKDQVLLRIRQKNVSQRSQQITYNQPYYMRYDKFCEIFRVCEVLHLRQHHNFTSIMLGESDFTIQKALKAQNSYFNVVQLIFDGPCFGSITISNEQKSDIKAYLYKLQHLDNQIMKLVGDARKMNKKALFFDCYFQQSKYYLFIQSSNSCSVISYMGQGKPELKVKQQILTNGLKNKSIEYLPVSNYKGYDSTKGNETMKNMGRTSTSNIYSSKLELSRKLSNLEELREMFIQLVLEQRPQK